MADLFRFRLPLSAEEAARVVQTSSRVHGLSWGLMETGAQAVATGLGRGGDAAGQVEFGGDVLEAWPTGAIWPGTHLVAKMAPGSC